MQVDQTGPNAYPVHVAATFCPCLGSARGESSQFELDSRNLPGGSLFAGSSSQVKYGGSACSIDERYLKHLRIRYDNARDRLSALLYRFRNTFHVLVPPQELGNVLSRGWRLATRLDRPCKAPFVRGGHGITTQGVTCDYNTGNEIVIGAT